MIFFLDESGQDRNDAPYEVRAALGVPNDKLWPLIERLSYLEHQHFGLRLHDIRVELKGTNALTRKRLKHSRQCPLMPEDMRRNLSRKFLTQGAIASKQKNAFKPSSEELAAYGQSCQRFILSALEASHEYGCKAFAAIVNKHSAIPKGDFLRKDYRYLLQRFFMMLDEMPIGETGLMVFDETETTESRRLMDQLQRYVTETHMGYSLVPRLAPTPFFVKSELTPVVQVVDFIAYTINWAVRFGKVIAEAREDLKPHAKAVRKLEWRGVFYDELRTRVWNQFGFFYLKNLDDDRHEKGGDTQSPPDSSKQEVHQVHPQSADQLLLFDDSLSSENKINKSRSVDKSEDFPGFWS